MKLHTKTLYGFLLLAALIVVLALAAKEASADTIIVAKDGSGNHTKIQDAIDAAGEGDTIRVYEGTYMEHVVVDKTVSLIGNGSANTIIDGRWEGNVVEITADWCDVSGFEVKKGANGIKVESDHNIISNNKISNHAYGIYIYQSSYNNISHNTISKNHYAIHLSSSSYSNISYNTISDNYNYGIYTYHSSYNNISHNTISDNRDHDGIYMYSSSNNNNISHNTMSNNGDDGISLRSSSNNTISNNTISNNDKYGICLYYSSHITFTGNRMRNNGIRIYGSILQEWNTHNINTTNTVNSRPVYYYKNQRSITVPSSAGQVILANCSYITVENQDLSSTPTGYLIGFSYSITATHNTISNNHFGICIYHSSNNTVSNNTISHNTNYGIYIYHSSNNTVSNNTISHNTNYGIYMYSSSNNNISNNTISNNNYGISLASSSNNNISNNTISLNTNCGIYIYASASYNSLSNNTCSNNKAGIHLNHANANMFFHNTISGNNVGIGLYSSSQDNTAHHNNIFNNADYGINATDNHGYSINATDNWWGHTSGPYHSLKNPDGKGDNVTDYVEFDPWLRRPPDYFPPRAIIDFVNPDIALQGEEVHFVGDGKVYNSITRYVWRSSLDGILYNDTFLTFSLSNISNGTHTIYLKVQDDYGVWSDEVETTLVVNGRPRAYIDPIAPNPAVEGETVVFRGYGTDDGSIANYSWRASLDGPLYNGTNSTFSLFNLSNGTHTVYLKVQDNYGIWSEEVSTTLTINGRPVAKITNILPNPAVKGQTVTFTGLGTDDGSIERYAWRTDDKKLYNGTNSTFTCSNISNGTHTIYLKVQDNYDIWSNEVSTTLTVNGKPLACINSITPSPANEGQAVTFTGSGTDDGTITRYSWRSNINEELYNSSSTTFSLSNLSNGTHTIFLQVQDDDDIWSDEVSAALVVNGKPRPHIDSISPNPAEEGEIVTFTANATDDGTISLFVWRSSLDQVLYNGTNASFTCSNLSVGDHIIYFNVRDNFGVWSEEVSTTLVVTEYIPPNKIPTVSITSPTNGSEVSGKVTLKGTASDEDGTIENVEVSISGGLWLPAEGTESWTFEWNTEELVNGNHTIMVRCYDGKNYSDVVSITVTVENKDAGEDGGDSDIFLFEKIGPLPLIAYIGIVAVVAVVGLVAVKKRKGKTKGAMTPNTIPSQQPAEQFPPAQPSYQQPQQLPQYPPAQLPYQQPPQYSPAQPPQQSGQPQTPQPYAQAPPAAPLPTQAAGTWTCPKCGNKVDGKFIFCTECGFRR